MLDGATYRGVVHRLLPGEVRLLDASRRPLPPDPSSR